MSLSCPGPIWDSDHVSACIQSHYLSRIIPAAACILSIIILTLRQAYLNHCRRQSWYRGYERIITTNPSSEANGNGRCADFSSTSTEPVYNIKNGIAIGSFEALLLIADIVLSMLGHARGLTGSTIVQVLAATYLLLLVITRVIIRTSKPTLVSDLWAHGFSLYSLQWISALLIAHTTLVVGTTRLAEAVAYAHLSLFTLLFMSSGSTSWNLISPHNVTDSREIAKEPVASAFSRLSFQWMTGLIWKGYKQPLEFDDLIDLNPNQKASIVESSFQSSRTVSRALVRRLFEFFAADLLWQSFWAAFMSVTVFLPPLLLRQILSYLEDPASISLHSAWFCVIGLLLSGVVASLADCQCGWIGQKITTKLNAILISEIYAKILKRTSGVTSGKDNEDEKEYASDGKVLNLMAVDAATIGHIAGYLHFVWISTPLQTVIAAIMLYNLLGVSGLAGIGIMILLSPLNIELSKQQGKAQREVLAATDKRLLAVNEAISNIRIIKYSAWEEGVSEKVSSLRSLELKKLAFRLFWWSISQAVFFSTPLLITLVTFFFYTVVAGNSLETTVAFPALAIFAILRVPLDRIAAVISRLLQANVSLQRIGAFLEEPETEKYDQFKSRGRDEITFEDASFDWPAAKAENFEEEPHEPPRQTCLSNLNVSFCTGDLNVVSGPTGSGKSALLLSLLGEMSLVSGCSYFPPNFQRFSVGLTAYCPQESWILNQTIRRNILFGLPFNSQRYKQVIEACALTKDFASLDKGDQTIAGEKGNRLSGGQKQRIALARALYSHAKLVLLDDCLSAIDSQTAKHVFFNAIKGPLMQRRTCILATHNVQLALPHARFAIFLEEGRIKRQGTTEQLLNQGLISEVSVLEDIVDDSASSEDASNGDVEGESEQNGSSPAETKMTGSIGWKVIKQYLFRLGGWWFWSFVLLGFAAQQLTFLGTNIWIKVWAQKYDDLEDKINPGYYLGIYVALCVSYVLVTFLRDIATLFGALRASSSVHKQLLKAIMNARLSFFDKTPLGQITNRFSKDIEAVDTLLAPFTMNAVYLMASLCTVIVFISAVLPAFLLVALAISIVFVVMASIYLNSSRDIKRISSVERSPLFQLFGETLSGYVSIRAYNRAQSFKAESFELTDRYNIPNQLLNADLEWIIFRIGVASAFISSITGAFVLWKFGVGGITPGLAGLVLTYSTTFTENMMFLVQLYDLLQQAYSSFERVVEYTQVEQEKSTVKQESDVSQWPSEGLVKFEGYATKYAPDLNLVLKNLTLEAQPGQRIAIVGRTGAGKSTLAMALIRGIEASEGRISIDGIDIASVSLQKLRSAITVVPQDPSLFNGSLRDNVDPLHKYEDQEIITTLHQVKLRADLDSSAAALSLGQRQLMCIARALLRRSRVLVLDEATASIDHETDALIQDSLRTSIAGNTTVFTIAHRLQTIADYDRVVVLDKGKVVEQGTVKELLEKRGAQAFFRRFCEETDDIETLERLAGLVSGN